ncbi:MAG: T9SS type A sorting domain-containing protein [Chitinophagaceae bacterium]|nr:T9SS type A sorting domain-containing protein [Chitinophagaceae bacterium]
MKISRDNDTPSRGDYLGTTGATHWIVDWDSGVTEKGSSGSPLFDNNHRILGQLHGGYSSCTSSDLRDWYGAFDLSWSGGGTNSTRLSNWLDPSGIDAMTTNTTNVSDLTPSINGDNQFCTTSSYYSIDNLPAGASVSWSVSPADIVTIDFPNDDQTTLTKTGNGTITLTATISTACTSNPIVISLSNIMVGLPNDIGLDVSAGMYDNLSDCGDGANFQVLYNAADNNQYSGTVFVTAANATSLSWTVAPWSSAQSWSWNESNNGHAVYVATKSANKEITLKATASNACGSIVKYYSFSTGACPLVLLSAPAPETYSISPNPAGYTFTVSGNADAENITIASFSRIGVYDAMGNLKKQTLFAAGTRKAQMSIAELPTGYYYVEISDGKTVQRKVLMVKR